MRFAFTEDQKMLRDTVREVLQRECAPSVVRAVWDGRFEEALGVWDTLAETGVIGMTAPEAVGGMAMQEVDFVLPFEEIGYSAYPGPLGDTIVAGIPLLEAAGTPAQKDQWLARAAAGQAKIVLSFEGEEIVPHAEAADLVIAERGGRAYCVPTGEISMRRERSVDRTRRLARVDFQGGAAHRMRDDVDHARLLRLAKERLTLAVSAELIGLSRRMLEMTVAYAKDRRQFGKPIGAQQAVKHRLADALIRQELARPLVYRAGWSMATGQEGSAVDVSLAKIYAGEAAKFVAKQALQVHGAIGYTIECDLHMWMKRVWALAASRGDLAFHRERVGRHVF